MCINHSKYTHHSTMNQLREFLLKTIPVLCEKGDFLMKGNFVASLSHFTYFITDLAGDDTLQV